MPARPIRVLCVDDNRDVADSEALLLSLLGYETRVSYDGLQALDAVRAFDPDVCLLDLNMPLMTGWEVAQVLRSGGSKALIVAVTARDGDDNFRRTKELGFDEHLVKPVMADRLLAVLARATIRPPV